MNSVQKRNGLMVVLAATAIAGVIFLSTRHEDALKKPAARRFESYRADFRKADGSLPNDTELMNQLVAKGIPILPQPDCAKEPLACTDPKKPNRTEIRITFATGVFSANERIAISEKLSAILARGDKAPLATNSGIRLERAEVTPAKSLQLFFDEAFSQIASDEGALTEFSESLVELGNTGIKKTEIYIAGKRLGEYLRELDLRRDQEALKAQPPTGSTR